MPNNHPKNKLNSAYRISRTGYNYRPALTARFNQSSFPDLNDPNLKAAAFHQNGKWVVVPGPASALYGQNYLNLTGALNSFATSPDSAAASVTGDLDIRIKLAPNTWTPASAQSLVTKYWSGAAQRSYLFQLSTAGTLVLWLSKDGITGQTSASTTVVPAVNGEVKWVRVAWRASDGRSQYFWSNDGSAWTQIGADVQHPYTGPLFDSTALLCVGAKPQDNTEQFTGKIFYAEVRSGINGQIVAKFDPTTDALVGATSFISGTGETWTLGSAATVQTGCPVSNSVANGFESTPFWPDSNGPLLAAKDITDATAPFVTATDAQALLGSTFWSSDHTLYALASPTLASSVNPVWWSHGLASTDGAFMQTLSGSNVFQCAYNGGASRQNVTTGANAPANGRWGIGVCGRSGANYVIRWNGIEIVTGATVAAANPSTRNLYFGRYDSTTFAMRGPLACVFFYSTAHTSAQKANIEALLTGNVAVGSAGVVPITTTRTSAVKDLGAVEPENLIPNSEPLLAQIGTSSGITQANGFGTFSNGAAYATGTISTDYGYITVASSDFTIGSTYTFSAYVKMADGSMPVVGTNTASGDFLINVAGLIAPSVSVVPIGNGIYRVIGTITLGSIPNAWAGIARYAAMSQKGFTVSGYQLNTGSTVQSYIRTYADARRVGPVLYTAGDNARIPNPTKGLPCFAAVTNLLLQSETFDNASWAKTRSSITANATIAPDRSVTADKLVEDATATSTHYTNQSVAKAASAITYTYSVFLKAAERTNALFQISNSTGTGGVSATVNLLTGALSSVGSSGTYAAANPSPVAKAESVGNGWWRVSITAISDTDTAIKTEAYTHNGTSVTYSGDGTSGFYIWGAQLEQNGFAGPYVPTTTASASSAMDISTISPNGWPVNGGEIELVYTPTSPPNGATRCLLSSFYGANQGLQLSVTFSTQTDQLNLVLVDGTGNSQVKSNTLTWVAGQSYTIKAIWGNGNAFIYRDGALVASDTSGTVKMPASHNSPAYIGSRNATLDPANGHIRVLYVGQPRNLSVPVAPLDLVTGASIAYSPARRLRAAYTGPLLRVRRSTDNIESDFYPNNTGALDRNAVSTFLAGNNGYVVTVYDQSGNGNNLTQAVTTKQPLYVASSQGDRATARFDGTDDFFATVSTVNLTATSAISTSIIAGNIPSGGDRVLMEHSTNFNSFATSFAVFRLTNNRIQTALKGNNGYDAFETNGTLTSGFGIITGKMDKTLAGTEASGWLNGDATSSGTIQTVDNSNAFGTDTIYVGARGGTSTFLSGDLPEMILYPIALSTVQRRQIEANQSAFYGIPVI